MIAAAAAMMIFFIGIVILSEFLSNYEVELASAVLLVVKAIAPVNSEQADHRKVDSHADTGRSLDLERIEVPDVRPAITSFQESQGENRRLRLEYKRITELEGKLVVDVSGIGIIGAVRGVLGRGERIVLITSEAYHIGTVVAVAAHSVTSEKEALEW